LNLEENGAVVRWKDITVKLCDQDLHFLTKEVANV